MVPMEGDFMKYIIVLLSFAIVFTQELEVEGDLKVTGNIDAQNNPIKNVGIPQTLTDAINGNVLQDALRDDGVYEYSYYSALFEFFAMRMHGDPAATYYNEVGNPSHIWIPDWETKVNQLSADGWKHSIIATNVQDQHFIVMYEFKRPIEE